MKYILFVMDMMVQHIIVSIVLIYYGKFMENDHCWNSEAFVCPKW